MLLPNLRQVLFILALYTTHTTALTSSLKQVTANIGSNPTNVKLYIYVPNPAPVDPAIILALHECGASGPTYFTQTQYSSLADTHGFIVLYPSAPGPGTTCWDVHSTATLTHNSGGDSLGVASFVRYAVATYGGDAARVFVTGTSSGAMMTNVLAGDTPLTHEKSLF
jgi:acetylxylan esterase